MTLLECFQAPRYSYKETVQLGDCVWHIFAEVTIL